MRTPAAIIGLLWIALVCAAGNDSLGERLIDAVMQGDVAHARELLDQWHRTSRRLPRGPDNKPLLFLAIEGRNPRHPEIIEILLANVADLQAKGPSGMTALHWAAWRGSAERTEQLLQHGAQIEATDDFGRTPLLVAQADTAEKLLAASCKLDRARSTRK